MSMTTLLQAQSGFLALVLGLLDTAIPLQVQQLSNMRTIGLSEEMRPCFHQVNLSMKITCVASLLSDDRVTTNRVALSFP